jgi:hypothetical protein
MELASINAIAPDKKNEGFIFITVKIPGCKCAATTDPIVVLP